MELKKATVTLFFLVLFWAPLSLSASVSASVDNPNPVFGDSVTLTLEGKGQDVVFPNISDIGGVRIESTGTSQNIQAVNGKVTKTISKVFVFTPGTNIVIPSFEVNVDGKVEKTKPIEITLMQPAQTQDADFILELKADKTTAYVGEQIGLILLFKRHKSAEVMDLQYTQSPYEHFWVKQNGKENTYATGDYIVHEIRYLGFPQKNGNYEVSPAKMRVGIPKKSRDIFGFWVKQPAYKNIFSNTLEFAINPAPQNVRLVGNFDIDLQVDTIQSEPNKPVNVTLEIHGQGNMDDIEEVGLDIPGATVYADKSEKQYTIENDVYKGTYKRTYAVVAGDSYTVPAIELRYFDIKNNRVITKKTRPVSVQIAGGMMAQNAVRDEVVLEKKEEGKEGVIGESLQAGMGGTLQSNIIYYLAGLFSGIVIYFLLTRFKHNRSVKNREKEMPIMQQIKKARSDKELLGVLIPLNNADETLDQTILKLEQNLYNNQKNCIDKKEILKRVKSLEEEVA